MPTSNPGSFGKDSREDDIGSDLDMDDIDGLRASSAADRSRHWQLDTTPPTDTSTDVGARLSLARRNLRGQGAAGSSRPSKAPWSGIRKPPPKTRRKSSLLSSCGDGNEKEETKDPEMDTREDDAGSKNEGMPSTDASSVFESGMMGGQFGDEDSAPVNKAPECLVGDLDFSLKNLAIGNEGSSE